MRCLCLFFAIRYNCPVTQRLRLCYGIVKDDHVDLVQDLIPDALESHDHLFAVELSHFFPNIADMDVD